MQGSTRMDQIEKIFSDSRLTFFIFSTQSLPWSKDLFKLSARQMDFHSARSVGWGNSSVQSQPVYFEDSGSPTGFCPQSEGYLGGLTWSKIKSLRQRASKPKIIQTQGSGSPTLPQVDLTGVPVNNLSRRQHLGVLHKEHKITLRVFFSLGS